MNFVPFLETGFKAVTGAVKTISDVWSSPQQKAIEAGQEIGGKIFNAPQKTTITPSVVSEQPTFNFFGYRPQVKDATTLSTTYKSWWDRKYEYGRAVWDNVKATYMGYRINELTKGAISTLSQSLAVTFDRVAQTLPNIIIDKLGLTTRPYSGDTVGNTPVRNHDPVYYWQPSKYIKNVPMQVEPKTWIESIMPGGQQKGMFNIGYEDTPEVVTTTPVNTGPVTTSGGGSFPVVPFVIGGIALWFFLRRGK